MVQPLVSILIPAYNAQEWIVETLRSAISQTWPHKEIIVIDDGSTDQTAAIAASAEFRNVLVCSQKQQGAAAARNRAFALSKGDYIQWLDADDILAPDKIEQQMKIALQCNGKRTLLSSSFGRFLYRWSRAKFSPTALWNDLSPTEWLLYKLETNAWMQTATWLVSRELTEVAGPWDTSMISDDDGEYFCRVVLNSDRIRFVSDAKVYYRALGYGSLAYLGNSIKKHEALWRSLQLHIEYLRGLDDGPRSRSACVAFLQRYLIDFYPEYRDIIVQAENLAVELGSHLEVPALPWKYLWLEKAFGWSLAKQVQRNARQIRWWLEGFCDKAFFRVRSGTA